MSADPYRTLGLEPGASMAEVKRAYRRLAKAFHPDSAGESALPRFLAVHEAYEAIRTGRPPSVGLAGERPAGAGVGGEPWRADPARARAARERARTPRTGRAWAGTTGSARTAGGSATSGTSGTSGTGGGSQSTRGAAGAAGGASKAAGGGSRSSGGTSRSTGRRQTRKATLGSTSYDDAREAVDAAWGGASWYGPTTGEYWIVNPREYADPRKHGPAYQSRARRAAADQAAEATELAGEAASAGADDEVVPEREPVNEPAGRRAEPEPAPAGPARARPSAAATERAAAASPPRPGPRTGPGGWDRQAAREWARGRDGEHEPVAEARRAVPDGMSVRGWLGGSSDDPVRRLGIALLAWPPLGLAAAAAIGDLTGCSVYSASCAETDALLPWLAQAGILGLLLLLTPLARPFAAGTLAVILALVPVTAFLVAVGGSGAPQGGFAMAFFLGAAWLAGVAWSLWLASRRPRVDEDLGAQGSPS
jgi:DnaJ-like protein